MQLLLGLDIGTSGVKALLISSKGEVIGSSSSMYPLDSPRRGWAQQSPRDWWEGTKEVIQKVLGEKGIDPSWIKGIGLSGQMHSSVFLDHRQEVIRPAILWSDTRTSIECQDILRAVGGLGPLIAQVANPALEGFTAPKLLWLKKNEPKNYKRVKHILLPKDYIRLQLTGELSTDFSDGAGTLLLDVVKKEWSRPLLKALAIDRAILPKLQESTTICGDITKTASEETGLLKGTPVVAGGADNACGAVGSGIIQEGRILFSIGSSGVVLTQTNKPLPDERGGIHLFNHALPNSWYMMGVMLSAGLSFSWLKDSLFHNKYTYGQLEKKTKGVPPGSGGLLFLPYLSGERTPHADAKARGVFFGISHHHHQGHFIRALMEGVSFGLLDSLSLMKEKGIKVLDVRLIGGGAKSSLWQQMLADMTGEEISLLEMEEGPAFGAALLAGVGTGLYQDFNQAGETISIKKTITANKGHKALYEEYYQLYKNLYRSLKGDFEELASLETRGSP